MLQPLQVAPWPQAHLGTTRHDGLTKVEPAKPRTFPNPGTTSCQTNRECGCRQQGAHRRLMNPGPERSQVYSGFSPQAQLLARPRQSL